MKNIFIVIFSFLAFSSNLTAQNTNANLDFRKLVPIQDQNFNHLLNNRQKSNNQLSTRAATIDNYTYNYLYWDSVLKSPFNPSTVRELRFVLNSKVDTNNIKYVYSAKRITQIFNNLPYAGSGSNVVSYDRSKTTVTYDSIYFDVLSLRDKTTVNDTLIIAIGTTTLGTGGITSGFDNVTNVNYMVYDTVIVSGNDTLQGYMYNKAPISFNAGDIPVVIMYYNTPDTSNGLGVAHGKTSLNCTSTILGTQNVYGVSHYAGVVKFSDGNFRVSFYNQNQLQADAPCDYFATQVWGIYPFATLVVDPQLSVSSNQIQNKLCEGSQVTLAANFTGITGDPDSTKYTWTPATGLSATDQAIVTATVQGTNTTYTVTAVNGTETDTKTISVTSDAVKVTLNSPTLSLTGCSDTKYGIASAISLLSTDHQYTWSDGTQNDSIAVNKPGDYTVTVTNQSGCTATSTLTVTANFTVPTLDFTIDPTGSICPNKDVTFTITDDAFLDGWSYNWKEGSSNDLGSDQSVTTSFTSQGTKSIYLSADSADCVATTKKKTVTVLSSSNSKCDTGGGGGGIGGGSSIANADNLKDAINIYPNPAKQGVVTVENTLLSPISIRVIDILGKEVMNKNLGKSQYNKVDVGALTNGIYFIEVDSNNDTVVKKLIVDK